MTKEYSTNLGLRLKVARALVRYRHAAGVNTRQVAARLGMNWPDFRDAMNDLETEAVGELRKWDYRQTQAKRITAWWIGPNGPGLDDEDTRRLLSANVSVSSGWETDDDGILQTHGPRHYGPRPESD